MDAVWIVRFSYTRMILSVWSSEELAEANAAMHCKAGRDVYVDEFQVMG